MLAAGETAAFPCGISLPQPGMHVGAARRQGCDIPGMQGIRGTHHAGSTSALDWEGGKQ